MTCGHCTCAAYQCINCLQRLCLDPQCIGSAEPSTTIAGAGRICYGCRPIGELR